jgi:hypothetical protein
MQPDAKRANCTPHPASIRSSLLMAIHYPKNLIGRCKQARLMPVSIGIGADIQWQGGVSVAKQLQLLAFLQTCQAEFPLDALPPPKHRFAKDGNDKTIKTPPPPTVTPGTTNDSPMVPPKKK